MKSHEVEVAYFDGTETFLNVSIDAPNMQASVECGGKRDSLNCKCDSNWSPSALQIDTNTSFAILSSALDK